MGNPRREAPLGLAPSYLDDERGKRRRVGKGRGRGSSARGGIARGTAGPGRQVSRGEAVTIRRASPFYLQRTLPKRGSDCTSKANCSSRDSTREGTTPPVQQIFVASKSKSNHTQAHHQHSVEGRFGNERHGTSQRN